MIEDDPEWQVYKRIFAGPVPGRVPPVSPWPAPRRASPASPPRPCTAATRPSTPPPICVWWRWVIWTPRRCSEQRRISCPGKRPRISPVTTVAARETPPAQSDLSCRMEVSMPSFLVGFKCPAPPRGAAGAGTSWGIWPAISSWGTPVPLFSRLYSRGLINGSFGGSFDLLPGRPTPRRRRQQRSRCRDGGHFRGGPTPDL